MIGPWQNRIARPLLIACLSVIPLVAVWLYKEHFNPRPFWVHFYDPEVAYYHSGRELLNGNVPHHVDHPGTPVQLLAAAAVAFTGDDPELIGDTLKVARWLLLASVLVGAFAVQTTLLRDLPTSVAVCSVWVFYICPASLQYLNVVGPEALYFFAGALFLALLWRVASRHYGGYQVALTGAMLGFGIAVKFLFLAWILPFLATLTLIDNKLSVRGKIVIATQGLVGVVLGFLISTSVVRDHYPYMLHWLNRLASRDGPHGSGHASFPMIDNVLHNWYSAALSAKGWYLLLACCLTACVARIRMPHGIPAAEHRRLLALTVFSGLSLIVSHVFVARHMSLHYLLPTGPIGVLLFALAFHAWRDRLGKLPLVLSCAAVAGLFAKHFLQDIQTHQIMKDSGLTVHRAVNQIIGEHMADSKPVIVFSFRTPQPSFASRFAAPEKYQKRLDRLFSREGHYYPWTTTIRLPTGELTWDLLVIREKDRHSFPERLGEMIARVDNYLIFKHP